MSTSQLSLESVRTFELPASVREAEFADYIAALDRCLDDLAPFVMIVDGSNVEGGLEEAPRGAWPRIRATRVTAFHKGVAFVTGPNAGSARVRALCAMQPPRVPHAFFSDRERALVWARQQLESVSSERQNRNKTVSLMAVGG
ncbi:hypothetical protein G6O69_17020 [Pseudenhygromyxa sp. WMMC2535]|uniref:hypothetical protein n=1 Tax=Pseudenhygromyxa sp. WMMC2535 TaxID=2712867 RepID=UPI0015573DCE|nr:hypothetical protein [Pseudenhygromyxa sp. WMMC2535]NVB39547.1 hypothetical protein [Pseudenhygromyxa sp. WMMC2535]